MMNYTIPITARAEASASSGAPIGDILRQLRELCPDDFGELLFGMPNPSFPALSAVLPAMASVEAQEMWTGTHGQALLRPTVNFVRSVAYTFNKLTGRDLRGSKILDFGCGYGRMIRLMYYFSDPERIFGVDPWDRPINWCHEDRVLGNIAKSDDVPRALPLPVASFDLIYAFSVFTHLSEKITRLALKTLSNYITKDGLLVITVRPEEYWSSIATIDPTTGRSREEVLADHRSKGFSFVPQVRPPIDGEVTYGDTSISFDWLVREIPEWSLVGYDRSFDDPYQILVFLKPRGR
jgi:SAM-dependent methyltransferase